MKNLNFWILRLTVFIFFYFSKNSIFVLIICSYPGTVQLIYRVHCNGVFRCTLQRLRNIPNIYVRPAVGVHSDPFVHKFAIKTLAFQFQDACAFRVERVNHIPRQHNNILVLTLDRNGWTCYFIDGNKICLRRYSDNRKILTYRDITVQLFTARLNYNTI